MGLLLTGFATSYQVSLATINCNGTFVPRERFENANICIPPTFQETVGSHLKPSLPVVAMATLNQFNSNIFSGFSKQYSTCKNITIHYYLKYHKSLLSKISQYTIHHLSMVGLNALLKRAVLLTFILVIFIGNLNKFDVSAHGLANLRSSAVKLSISQDLTKVIIELKGIPEKPYKIDTKKRSISSTTNALTCLQLVKLTRDVVIINILLNCNDISLNPGPNTINLNCTKCLKTIRRTQPRTQCSCCGCPFHLRCLHADFDSSRLCGLCTAPPIPEIDINVSNGEATVLPDKFTDMLKLRGLKLIQQNIRSLLPKIDELRLMITESDSQIHILALTETWLNDLVSDAEISIPGYRIYRKDRGAKGGGIAIYIKNDLPVERRSDLEFTDMEGIWLEVILPKTSSVFVGTYYRPPNSSVHLNGEFMTKLESTLDALVESGREIIILGDLNCDLMPNNRPVSMQSKRLQLILKLVNFVQLIKQPTRCTENSATLLDFIATNYPRNIREAGVIMMSLSDHEITYCVRKMNWNKSSPKLKTFRNYARYNAEELHQDLRNIDWHKVVNSDEYSVESPLSVTNMWMNFKKSYIKIIDCHAPLIKKKVRGSDSCLWVTSDIKKSIQQRDYIHGKARKTNSEDDWSTYRLLRNQVTKLIKSAKGMYNKRLIERNSDNPKMFWKTLKKILPMGKKIISPNINVNGSACWDAKKIENAFNNFFTDSTARLADSPWKQQ